MSKVLAVIVSALIPVSVASAKVAAHRPHRHHTSQYVLPPGATGVYCFNSPDTPPTYAGPPAICILQFP
jgi:hypothetical protein